MVRLVQGAAVERTAVQRWCTPPQAMARGRLANPLRDQLRPDALAFHAQTEVGVIVLGRRATRAPALGSSRRDRPLSSVVMLFLGERHKPASALGHHAREMLDALQADLVAAAVAIPAARDIPLPRRQLIARGLVTLSIEFGLAQCESKDVNEDDAVSLLCAATLGLIQGAISPP
jgi:hypothetical protein